MCHHRLRQRIGLLGTMRRVALAFCLLIVAVPALAVATDGASLRALGWRALEVPGKAPAEFHGLSDRMIEVRADKAVSFLYRELGEDEEQGRYLSWSWRVDVNPMPTDLARKGEDDRPLAVHVWFEDDSMGGNVFDWFGEIVGLPMHGRTLTYVWGGVAEVGASFPNPYHEDGAIIVLRNGATPTGTWYRERIDLAADFTRVFGFVPRAPRYIAISADTDDTGDRSLGRIADLRFVDESGAEDG